MNHESLFSFFENNIRAAVTHYSNVWIEIDFTFYFNVPTAESMWYMYTGNLYAHIIIRTYGHIVHFTLAYQRVGRDTKRVVKKKKKLKKILESPEYGILK